MNNELFHLSIIKKELLHLLIMNNELMNFILNWGLVHL